MGKYCIFLRERGVIAFVFSSHNRTFIILPGTLS